MRAATVAKCLLLKVTRPYSHLHDALLREVLLSQPALVAIVGVECDVWEEALDMMGVQMDARGGREPVSCNTSAHPDETLQQAAAFAQQWCTLQGWTPELHVLEI